MRAELKTSRGRIRDLEATLGINRKQGEAARQTLEKITGARPNPIIVKDLEEAKRALHTQQIFIHGLQDELRLGICKNQQAFVVGAARTLPPIGAITEGSGCPRGHHPGT